MRVEFIIDVLISVDAVVLKEPLMFSPDSEPMTLATLFPRAEEREERSLMRPKAGSSYTRFVVAISSISAVCETIHNNQNG